MDGVSHDVWSLPDEGKERNWIRLKKRKVYVPKKVPSGWMAMLSIYLKTVGLHLERGLVGSYLVCCTHCGEYGLVVGITLFGLSSLELWWRLIGLFTGSKRVQKWQGWYSKIFPHSLEFCGKRDLGRETTIKR